MKEIVKNKITKDDILDIAQTFAILFFIGGVFGFIYEELFYRIDLGYWIKRGITFGPWIPIYGFGTLLIFAITYFFKERKLLVFSLTCIITCILEFSTGLILDKICGLRLWNYNEEILNFGNINGYICLRSILFFGISGLFLMYSIYPITKKIKSKCNRMIYNIICFVPTSVFLIDFLINITLF